MIIQATSDTHGSYRRLTVPAGDLFIHAGDCTSHGKWNQFESFVAWMKRVPCEYKILIPGNHDRMIQKQLKKSYELCRNAGVTMLIDEAIEIGGYKFYGSPWTPTFRDWYFMRDRGADIKEVWNKIPDNTDVLIIHGPPYGILDKNAEGINVGCEELYKKIMSVKPLIHISGHIHEGRGYVNKQGIDFYNVSSMDGYYFEARPVIEIEI